MEWSEDGVQLIEPSVDQCMEVISKLEDKHEIITLTDSSSESIEILVPTILEKETIKELYILSCLTRDNILSIVFFSVINKQIFDTSAPI